MEPIPPVERVHRVQPNLASSIVTHGEPPLQVVSTAVLDFDAWYRATRPTVARALALSIGDDELAQEATDEAMTRAYQSWSKVQNLDNPGGWVYRVGLNWAMSVFRRRRPAKRAHHVIATDMPMPADIAIQAALDALDVKHRSVVVCRHLLGWSEQQTAEILQIRPGTVKSRLSRATTQLRDRLGHLRPESSL